MNKLALFAAFALLALPFVAQANEHEHAAPADAASAPAAPVSAESAAH